LSLVGIMRGSQTAGRHSGIISSVHPFNKALLPLGLLVLVLTSASPGFHFFLLVMLFSFLFYARMPLSLLARRMVIPAFIVFSFLLVNTLQYGDTVILSLSAGGVEAAFYREGLLRGAFTGLRVFSAVTALILFSQVTTFREMLSLAKSLRIPLTLVELVVYTYNFSFYLGEEASRIMAAQKLRLGHRNRWSLLSSYGTMGGMIFIRSYDRAGKINRAQKLRCYRGKLYLPAVAPLKRKDYYHLSLVLVIILLLGTCSILGFV